MCAHSDVVVLVWMGEGEAVGVGVHCEGLLYCSAGELAERERERDRGLERERGGTQVLQCFHWLRREEGWESEGI